MNTQKIIPSIKSKTRLTLQRMKKIKLTKKTLLRLTLVILLAMVLIVVYDYFSIKNIVGIQRKTDKIALGLSTADSDLNPANFKKSVSLATSENGSPISVEYTVTGDEKIDSVIVSEIQSVIEKLKKNTYPTTLLSESRAYKDVVFTTLFPTEKTENSYITVIGTTKVSVYNISQFLKPGFESTAINTAAAELNTRFSVDITKARSIIGTSINNKSYRMASNGLVLIIPSYDLPQFATSTPYYEVLIPNQAISAYLVD